MKRSAVKKLVALTGLCHAMSASAATIALYEMTAGSTASTDAEAETTMSIITTGAGISGHQFTNDRLEIGGDDTAGNSAQDGLVNNLNHAITNNTYFSFTLTIPDTHWVDLTSLEFDYQTGGTNGAYRFATGLFTDATGFTGAADAVAGSTIYVHEGFETHNDNVVSLAGASFQGLTDTTLEFRFYLSDRSTSDTRIHYFDNIELFGDLTFIPCHSGLTPFRD